MLISEWWVKGTPAPYSTRGESFWKQDLARVLPIRKNGFLGEKGIDIEFHLHLADDDPRVPDVDNLCEPVFSVLVNKLGWFGGKRLNIYWWRARKIFGEKSGCKMRLFSGSPPQFHWEPNQLIIDSVFKQSLLLSSSIMHSSALLSNWRYHLLLQFGDSSLNLGDIATGVTKSIIDHIFPHPHDKWITDLQVEKGNGNVPKAEVRVMLWRKSP
jgi:hypothetical protein